MGGRCSPLRIVGQAPARTGILAPRVAVGCGQGLGDLGARAETGIDQSTGLQAFEGRGVGRRALRLDDRLSVMPKPEPVEILENGFDEFGTTAAGIEILDPEQELAAAGSGEGMADRRRIGVAQVKPSRGRWGKTCDLQDSLHGKGDSGDS